MYDISIQGGGGIRDLTKCFSFFPQPRTIGEKIQRIMHWTNEVIKVPIGFGICAIPMLIIGCGFYGIIVPKVLLTTADIIYFCLK